jgi:hypothetical protein
LKNKYAVSKNKKAMCRMSVGTKSMTKNKTEGLACGRAKKTGGVLINTLKINSISFIKTAGFFALWGGSGCGFILVGERVPVVL